MAALNWLVVYRRQSTEYLQALEKSLLKQAEDSFSAQAQGTKSYELATAELQAKLEAIGTVLNEREGKSHDRDYIGTVDHSCLGGIS